MVSNILYRDWLPTEEAVNWIQVRERDGGAQGVAWMEVRGEAAMLSPGPI